MSDKQCPICNRRHVGPIRTWRLSTMYVNDEMNFATCCYRCVCDIDHGYYWDWQEYYYSQGVGYYDRQGFRPRRQSDYMTLHLT